MNKLTLNKGEHDAGIFIGKNSTSSYRIIIMPGELINAPLHLAKEFATKLGGVLPTNCELLFLFNNSKDQYKNGWYWSGDLHPCYDDCAYSLNFQSGENEISEEYCKLSARAIRRMDI